MFSISKTAKFRNYKYNKNSIKSRCFMTNAATYYFLSIKDNAQVLLVRLLLYPHLLHFSYETKCWSGSIN